MSKRTHKNAQKTATVKTMTIVPITRDAFRKEINKLANTVEIPKNGVFLRTLGSFAIASAQQKPLPIMLAIGDSPSQATIAAAIEITGRKFSVGDKPIQGVVIKRNATVDGEACLDKTTGKRISGRKPHSYIPRNGNATKVEVDPDTYAKAEAIKNSAPVRPGSRLDRRIKAKEAKAKEAKAKKSTAIVAAKSNGEDKRCFLAKFFDAVVFGK